MEGFTEKCVEMVGLRMMEGFRRRREDIALVLRRNVVLIFYVH